MERPFGQAPLHEYSGETDIVVLKLNSSGAYQWHTFYGSTGWDGGIAIAVDSSSNVYVTGGSSGGTWNGPTGEVPLNARSGAYSDVFVLKLNSGGAYQWHTFYVREPGDYKFGFAVDNNSNIYITYISDATWDGPTESPLHPHSGDDDIVVLKLNCSGAYQWHTFYGSASDDSGHGLTVNYSGNAYVTGVSSATWSGPAGESPLHAHGGGRELFVLKLNSSGTYQWHTFYGSTDYDFGNELAVDINGNVYVMGDSNAAGTARRENRRSTPTAEAALMSSSSSSTPVAPTSGTPSMARQVPISALALPWTLAAMCMSRDTSGAPGTARREKPAPRN